MKIMAALSDMILPLVIVYILAYGYSRKINVYEEFIEGAKDGFKIVLEILPTLIGLMMAVGILRASGSYPPRQARVYSWIFSRPAVPTALREDLCLL